jgi:hypothetical protein
LPTTNAVIEEWRFSLGQLHDFYVTRRPPLRVFYPALFLFFVLVNDLCYWLAMTTAFPDLVTGYFSGYYFKIQFPVALLGALFDSLSFFVTLHIVRRALVSTTARSFIGHLSIDLVIAVLATFWVLFVFVFSSWLMRHFDGVADVRAMAERQAVYQDRVMDALQQPTRNLRNIYFGLVMGTSAMLPTVIHVTMALQAVVDAGDGMLNRLFGRRRPEGAGPSA